MPTRKRPRPRPRERASVGRSILVVQRVSRSGARRWATWVEYASMYFDGAWASLSCCAMRSAALPASSQPPYLSSREKSPVVLTASTSSMSCCSASERGTAGAGGPHQVSRIAAVTQGFPKGGVGGHPGAEPLGLETVPTTRIGIDEGPRGSATGDGEVAREVAAGGTERGPAWTRWGREVREMPRRWK